MEFLVNQPSVLPATQYTYQAQAIFQLAAPDSNEGGLGRVISRGSQGRRSSFGAGNEEGGGLRKILSRSGGGENAADGTGRRSSEVAPATNGRRGSMSTDRLKVGKWEAKATVGVTSTHLVIALETPLVLYNSPGTPGDSTQSGGGIGDKIKAVFGRRSSTIPAEEKEAAAEPTPAAAAPSAPLGDLSFPSYVNGQAVQYVTVPLNAIQPTSDVKEYKDKRKAYNLAVISVPVKAHFASLVNGMTDRQAEDSWGRAGKIKFEFNQGTISGKAEAEVLLHAIKSSVEAVSA